MVDHRFNPSSLPRVATTRRRGISDRRPLILVGTGVVVAVVLLAVLWRSGASDETSGRKRLVDLDRIVVPSAPTSDELSDPATELDRDVLASLDEGASVQVADEQGRLAQEYGAMRIDPLPDAWVSMEQPWARFHPSSGRLVAMEAKAGRMRVPEQAIESGRLEEDVRIEIYDAGVEQADLDRTRPAITILADVAEYDASLGEIRSPRRVEVLTDEATFVGEDLRIVFDEDGERIERLTVARALEPIRLRPETRASTTPAGDAVPTRGATTSPGGRGGDAAVPRATPVPASAPRVVAQDSVGGSPDEASFGPEDVYRLVLEDDVVIERVAVGDDGDVSRSQVRGDRLVAAFVLGEGGPGTEVAMAPRTRVVSPSGGLASHLARSLPTSTSTGRIAPADAEGAEVLIHYSGRLVMTPAPDLFDRLRHDDDAEIVVEGTEGRGVELADESQGATGEAAVLTYRLAEDRIDLVGDETHPLSIRSPQFSLDGGRFWLVRSTGEGGLVGPGRMGFDETGRTSVRAAARAAEHGIDVAWRTMLASAPHGTWAEAEAAVAAIQQADGESMPRLEIVWEGGVDLDFAEDSDDAQLRQARFRGDVEVAGDAFRLGSDTLVVDFADGGGEDDIERILAAGNAKVDRVGEFGRLEASSIDVGLSRSDDGRTVPTEMIAEGGVTASDPAQTLWTERLIVRFREMEGASDEARSSVATGDVEDLGPVEVHTVDAVEAVQVRLEEGARVFADRLEGDAANGTLQLTGQDVMVARANVIADRMREVRLDESSGTVRSPGPGRFRYFDDPVVPARTDRIERPDPPTRTSLAATWTEAMSYRQDEDGRGFLDLDGKVRVRSTPDARTRDRLDARSVRLSMSKDGRGSARAGGDRADRILGGDGETTLETLTARGDAILESREWADGTRTGDPRLFRVTGDFVEYQVETGEALVDGPGGLLVHDPTPGTRAPEADRSAEAGFGVDGTSRFRWEKRMTMTRQIEDRYLVVMEKGVEVLHAGLDQADTMTLTGNRLEVTLDRPDGAAAKPVPDTGAVELGGPAEVLRVRGLGAVFVRTPDHDVECEEFDYNVDTGIAMLRAAPGRVVTIQSKSANTPIRADRIQWDLRTGRLRILGGEGGIAR